MKLSEDEKEIIEIFKDAGFSGRVFRSSSDGEKWALSDQRAVLCRHYYQERRKTHPEACKWHVEENDPKCKGCSRSRLS